MSDLSPDPIWPKPFLSNGTYEVIGWKNGEPVWRRRPWKDNAELIAEVLAFYSPRPTTDVIMDVSYGRGRWWSRSFQPDIRHGLDVEGKGEEFDDGVDFRNLPEKNGSVDVIAYDPPYVSTGGEATNEDVEGMRSSYGIGPSVAGGSPEMLQLGTINPGLTEVHSKLVVGGLALVKCCNYISSGELWPGEFFTLQHAQTLDFALLAAYTFDKAPGPQPKFNLDGSVRIQASPRNNTSTLYVLQRTKGTS